MNDPKPQAEALACELELHLNDLLDDGHYREIGPDESVKVATLTSESDEEVGTLLETGEVKDQPNAFYVTLLDGNRFKVTVEHVPDVVPPNSFLAYMQEQDSRAAVGPDMGRPE